MKKGRFFLISVIGLLVIFSLVYFGPAFAEELKGETGGNLNSLNSGYAITRWPWTGGDIYVGQDATVRACTVDSDVNEVTFLLKFDDEVIYEVRKSITPSDPDDTWDGDSIYDAYDTQTLNIFGDEWGVQAIFHSPDADNMPPDKVAIRAISWNAIPEVPFGTIATIITMLGALGVFTIFRGRISPF